MLFDTVYVYKMVLSTFFVFNNAWIVAEFSTEVAVASAAIGRIDRIVPRALC